VEKRHRRPLAVTLTVDGVLLLGGAYLLQSGQALLHYRLLDQLTLSVPAWYPPLSAAFWGILWLALGVGLWRRRERARRWTLIVLPLQIGAWLADELLFGRSEIAIQSLGFDLALRLLGAGLASAALLLSGRWEGDAKRESTQPHGE
jgi:hypothetical protein